MTRTLPVAAGAVILLVLTLFNTTYTVNYHELAVATRFGKPMEVVRQPGLHFKAPFFIDSVTKLDTRLQLSESNLETVLTKDGQQVVVRAFLLWRVDPKSDTAMDFFTSYGTLDSAGKELETRLNAGLRGAVGRFAFTDLIGANSRLPDAEQAILEDLNRNPMAGVEARSVGLSQVVLPPKTTIAVVKRMSAVQETLANLEESRGQAEADAIKSQAASQADTIRNFADQWAAEIEAVGNTEATRYYEQMKQEADLAIFLAWLDTLRASLTGSTTFVTDMTKAPFHMIDLDAPTDANGIPQPQQRTFQGGGGK
jgi:membrane protease subunit HflC